MRLFNLCTRFCLPCLFLGIAALGPAQAESVADGTMPAGIAPGTPAGSYPLKPFEHYDPFSGALNVTLPLHHIGGRGQAGFDLVWNFQQTWLAAKRFGGANPFIPIDPYPIENLAGPEGVDGPLGAGTVFERTGSAFILDCARKMRQWHSGTHSANGVNDAQDGAEMVEAQSGIQTAGSAAHASWRRRGRSGSRTGNPAEVAI